VELCPTLVTGLNSTHDDHWPTDKWNISVGLEGRTLLNKQLWNRMNAVYGEDKNSVSTENVV